MRARGVGFAVAVVFVLTLLPIHRALGGSALEYKCSTAGTLSVCADMAKYLPDSWAYVSGNGYAPDSALTIRVTRPDGSMVSGDGTGAAWPTAYDTVVTDAEGHFDYFYFVNGTAGTYVADVMDGGSVVSACSFACFAGSKPKVDDGASTTTTVLSMVTLEWNDPASAPTQMRVANDATPEDGCSDLGGGSYTAWQPVTDSNGTNSMDFAWTLDAGPEGQRSVCVEAAKGALDVPIDSAVDEDQILLAVENPPLGDACGLDVVLVIDVSGSVNSTQLAQSKAAFVGFVNALLPSTPTQFAVVEFSTTANVLLGFSSSPATVIAAINSAGGGGSTNWDDALYDARLLFPNRLDKPDLIIFSSDGNPNYRGGHASHGSPTSVSPATALSFAVTEADAAKTAGIRIIALGIGSGVNIANLQAISSPDAVITSGFDTLADDLADLAIQICGGTITVNKLIDADGNLATTGDQTPAMGWTFSTNVDAPDFSTPASGMTDGSGQINFDIDLGDDLSAVVDVIETPQAGYALLSASCTVSGTPSGLAVNDITVSPLDVITCTFINAALCGNGTVDVGEDCDDGNTVDGDCCSSTCTFEIAGTACGNQTPEGACDLADVCDGAGMCVSNRVPSGTECRAAAGDCDVPEFCDGVAADCPSDALEPNTTECRASAGVCDPAEFCTGSSADCPADVLEPGSTECRASAGECDQAEFCTGSSADCPADGFEPNTTECRASAGVCDSAEFCTGTSASCPSDVFEPDTIECRSSTGVCDPAEFCTGSSADCPADVLEPGTTECRASAGDCDPAEFCTGSSADCPADVLEPGTTECRASAGACDPPEFCTGSSADCPADVFEPGSTECRPAAGVCDVAEFCTGSDADCPADAFLPDTTECNASTGDCDPAEYCTGSSADCPADEIAPFGTVCRVVAGPCDIEELCDGVNPECPTDEFLPPYDEKGGPNICRAAAGSCDVDELCPGDSAQCPPDSFEPSTTECRPAFDVCDVPEFCTGIDPNCPPQEVAPLGTLCRDAAGDCDVAEECDGINIACPPDGFEPSSTECRASMGICDPAEFCTGTDPDCPEDVLEPGTVECRAAADVCDVPEFCTGTDPGCPTDGFEPDTTECRASTGVCDPAELCTGTGPSCPPDLLEPGTTECRAAADICDVPEFCTGSDPDCPTDGFEPDTTECRASAGVCDPAELCTGTGPSCPPDLLEPDTTICRADAGDCDVAELCTGSSPDCPPDGFEPSGTTCTSDNDECTSDVCNATGMCTHPDNQLCGACCLPDKDCLEPVLEGTCEGFGGSFNGAQSVCLGDSDGDGIDDLCDNCPGVDDNVFGTKVCSNTGAHCTGDADCGFGETCEKACIGKIPAASEWGLAVLALMLLVAGKLYFGRQVAEVAQGRRP